MEKLIKELKTQIAVMHKMNGNKYNLSDVVLNNLYSVYPFNKFEYIILTFATDIWNETNIYMFLK